MRFPPPPIIKGGMGPLEGLRLAVHGGDPVVVTRVAERRSPEEAVKHRNRFREPLDASPDRLPRQAGLLVLDPVPAGAQADLQATVAQDVERREL
jgi:hypothetical protein